MHQIEGWVELPGELLLLSLVVLCSSSRAPRRHTQSVPPGRGGGDSITSGEQRPQVKSAPPPWPWDIGGGHGSRARYEE